MTPDERAEADASYRAYRLSRVIEDAESDYRFMRGLKIVATAALIGLAIFLTSCVQHSPGAKVSTTVNVSIVPATAL